MAFIGNSVQTQGFTPAIDYFSGNGSTVTFTLSRPVASVAQMIVAIDNVIQNPSSSFTVSGNAITFSSAPLAGTNNIWVEYTSLITTYAAISQSPSVIGDITASGGYLASGSFNNSFLDGTIVDYVTGNGRLTVGAADGFTIYNGGTSARSALASWTQTGALTLPADATINGLTVGKGSGSVAGNTAIGVSALNGNTSGANNTAVGYQAGYSNTTGAGVTAIGYQAGNANTTASYSTFVGQQAGLNTTGTYNTFLGTLAGYLVTSGTKNTVIGGFPGNQGGLDIRTASNYIVLSDGDGNPRGVFTSGTGTATFPTGSGTVAVQGASTNITSGTAVASTSGTSIDFTSIPSWVKRITVMFNGVGTNGSSKRQVQLGAGSIDTSSYTGGSWGWTGGSNGTGYTSGICLEGQATNSTSYVFGGVLTICYMGSNVWSAFGTFCANGQSVNQNFTGGTKSLSGVLDRIRITTINGTDTFNAGSINILYE